MRGQQNCPILEKERDRNAVSRSTRLPQRTGRTRTDGRGLVSGFKCAAVIALKWTSASRARRNIVPDFPFSSQVRTPPHRHIRGLTATGRGCICRSLPMFWFLCASNKTLGSPGGRGREIVFVDLFPQVESRRPQWRLDSIGDRELYKCIDFVPFPY